MPRLRRALFLCLCLCVLLFVFCGCSSEKTVLSYGAQTLSERLYTYMLMLQKTKTLSALTGTTENLTDSAELWQTDDGAGNTFGERLLQSVCDEACISLFYQEYAAKNKLSLSAEESAAAKKNADNIVSAFSSREDFDRYMKTYGSDYQLILDYYNFLALTEAGMKAYYSAPATSLTPADCRAYYRDRYITCRYFYLSLASKTLPNGKTVPLSEEETDAVLQKSEALKAAMERGEDLAPYLENDVKSFSFSDGQAQTLTLDSLPDAVSGALKDIDAGVISIEADSGIYLCEKYALNEDGFDALANEIYSAIVSVREQEILEEKQTEFLKNESFFTSLSIADVPIFSD